MRSPVFFGFRQIEAHLKESLVGQVFKSVASDYDKMNDMMSLGIHRYWKNCFIKAAIPSIPVAPVRVLDVAGGTGDISFRLANTSNKVSVTCLDINPAMLSIGYEKQGMNSRLDWLVGNAENLQHCSKFPTGDPNVSLLDNSFDLYTIAFGIRNCTHVSKVLKEAYRILKPGGRFLCLEFCPNPSIPGYDLWSKVIPEIGKWVANDRDSYQYLVESIKMFPNPDHFASCIETAGFKRVKYEPMTGGIVAIHQGIKLPES